MPDAQILATLMERKRHCLEQLHALGKQQLAAIRASDLDGLFAMLDARQKWLQAFERIEGCLQPFRNEDPARRRWTSETLREQCRADQERCQQLLAEITSWEEQGRAELEMQRDQTALELRHLHADCLVNASYESDSNSPITGQHLDLSAET